MLLLFPPAERGLPRVSEHWYEARDGDGQALQLFMRHYSCRKPHAKLGTGNAARIGGPGERITLLTGDGSALFVWRYELHRMDGKRVSTAPCSAANRGGALSSTLIREADEIAWERWPGERHFTFVDPRRVRSSNPGFCFLQAGWTRLERRTRKRKLVILERLA